MVQPLGPPTTADAVTSVPQLSVQVNAVPAAPSVMLATVQVMEVGVQPKLIGEGVALTLFQVPVMVPLQEPPLPGAVQVGLVNVPQVPVIANPVGAQFSVLGVSLQAAVQVKAWVAP